LARIAVNATVATIATTATTASPLAADEDTGRQPQAVISPISFISANGARIHFPPSLSQTWLIGREDPVANIHPEVDLTLYDAEQTVSRRHAQIKLVGGQPILTTIAATNWTRLNGACLEPNEPVMLHHGDRVEFAHCRVTVEFEFG
jgi:pSer/pThr/pTyr-binding forkhead associated (FHA) protein